MAEVLFHYAGNAGFALLRYGFLLLFFMVIRIIEPGFLPSFLAYTAGSIGFILGLTGIVQLHRGLGGERDSLAWQYLELSYNA